METNNTHKTVKDLKNDIKAKVEFQKKLKQHRKTSYEGERMLVEREIWERNPETNKCEKVLKKVECTPYRAYELHQFTRYQLRIMNVAYGVLRGKKLCQIENRTKEFDGELTEENHPLNWIKSAWLKIVEEYSGDEKTVCTD